MCVRLSDAASVPPYAAGLSVRRSPVVWGCSAADMGLLAEASTVLEEHGAELAINAAGGR